LLDPDGDEEERRVLGERAVRNLDDREHAFRLGAVAHLTEHALVDLLALVPAQERGREVGRVRGEPRRLAASNLPRPFTDEQSRPPPLAPLPKPQHLLDARIVHRRDHGQGESSHVWWLPPPTNCANFVAELRARPFDTKYALASVRCRPLFAT